MWMQHNICFFRQEREAQLEIDIFLETKFSSDENEN